MITRARRARPARARNQAGPHRPAPVCEPICPGELWPIALLHERLGWGSRTVAAARLQGLSVHRWGKRAYVLTDDLIALLTAGNGGAPDSESAGEAAGTGRKHSGNGELLPNSL